MSSYVKLVGDQLIRYQWDSDLRDKYQVKKIGEQRQIISKETNNIIETYDSAEESDEFFYQAVEFVPIVCLNEKLEVNKNATLGQLKNAILAHEEYKNLILDNFSVKPTQVESFTGNLNIIKSAILTDNEFNINYPLRGFPALSDKMNINIIHNMNFLDTRNSKTYNELYDCITLLDAIIILFDDTIREGIVKITSDGFETPLNADIMSCLFLPVEFEEGLKFGEFIKSVANNPKLTDFIAQFAWVKNIDKFHDLINKKTDIKSDMDYLEIETNVKHFSSRSYPSLNYHLNFVGIGKPDEDLKNEHYEPGGLVRYSVSTVPLNEMIDLPIILKQNTTINIDGDIAPIVRKVSVLDVLYAVYDDISFHGDPDDNEQFIEDMKATLDEIKNNPDSLKEYNLDDLLKDEDDDS